jgi:hypothetical protein
VFEDHLEHYQRHLAQLSGLAVQALSPSPGLALQMSQTAQTLRILPVIAMPITPEPACKALAQDVAKDLTGPTSDPEEDDLGADQHPEPEHLPRSFQGVSSSCRRSAWRCSSRSCSGRGAAASPASRIQGSISPVLSSTCSPSLSSSRMRARDRRMRRARHTMSAASVGPINRHSLKGVGDVRPSPRVHSPVAGRVWVQ